LKGLKKASIIIMS